MTLLQKKKRKETTNIEYIHLEIILLSNVQKYNTY